MKKIKSGKLKAAEIRQKRGVRKARVAAKNLPRPKPMPAGSAAVNAALLAPNNSYGVPQFVHRGYYLDLPFRCQGCGRQEVWTATQQKWWYEVAKGFAYSTANLCRACRRQARARSNESRRLHLEGLARKKAGNK